MVMAPLPPNGFSPEQLEPLIHWFESCNGAQQATLGAALLSRADVKAAHLLHTLLERRITVASLIWRQEIQLANDPGNGTGFFPRDIN